LGLKIKMRNYNYRKRILLTGGAGFPGSDSRAKIVLGLPLMDDPKKRCPDISPASEKFGWQPHTPLEQGLKKTIAYFEDLLRSGLDGAEVTSVWS
jgi:nucleoside-diphosphate-sugar epimerase